MPVMDRVTVTLPHDVLLDIDRLEKNRSKFVLEAVRQELESRRDMEYRKSLDSPHPESQEFESLGFDAWAIGLPVEDAEGLVDSNAGTEVRWIPGEGWLELAEEERR